ncbi:MAG: hypothetical protein ACLR8L_16245 [Oscillospiraceae bacterium]
MNAETFVGAGRIICACSRTETAWKGHVEYAAGICAARYLRRSFSSAHWIAVLLTKVSRRRSDVLRAVYLIPLLISPLIVGLIWRFHF